MTVPAQPPDFKGFLQSLAGAISLILFGSGFSNREIGVPPDEPFRVESSDE